MAKYKVTAPDGKQLVVTGPEGASQEEVLAKAQELYAAQQEQSTATEPEAVTEEPQEDQDPLTAGEVASGAVESFLPSLGREVSGIWEAVTNPIDTASTVLDLGAGVLQNVLPESVVQLIGEDEESRALASAVGEYIADRYGGLENIKKTIATDSAGFAADLAGLLSGGSTIAAKIATKSSKLAKAAPALKKAAEKAALIDPITLTAKVGAKGTTKVAGKVAAPVLALTSGVGKKSIEQAYEAGFEGGKALEEFRDNMKGADPQLILDDAMANLEKLRQEKNATYASGMKNLEASDVKIGYNKIDYALNQAKKKAGSIDTKTSRVLKRVESMINQAKESGFNSPVQMDELKRAINEVRMDQPAGSQRQTVVAEIQNTIRDTINKAAPEYGKTMELYADASEKMKELKQVLSVGKNPDTALRKLLSVMRDNVQTNYGKRATLAEELGGSSLLNKIAGQELSSLMPRGITGRLLGGGAVGFGAVTGGVGGLLTPGAIPALAAASPRLIGEAAQLTGQARRVTQRAAQVLPSATPSYLGIAGRDLEEEER
jgi:hypothetical protein